MIIVFDKKYRFLYKDEYVFIRYEMIEQKITNYCSKLVVAYILYTLYYYNIKVNYKHLKSHEKGDIFL